MVKQLWIRLVVIVCVVTVLVLPAWGNIQDKETRQKIIGIGEEVGHGIGKAISFLTALKIAEPVLIAVINHRVTLNVNVALCDGRCGTASSSVITRSVAKSLPLQFVRSAPPVGKAILIGAAAVVAFAPKLCERAGGQLTAHSLGIIAPIPPEVAPSDVQPVWKN